MIYIVVYETAVYKHPGYFISCLDIDSANWDEFESNSIWVDVPRPKVAQIEAGIARNVFTKAGHVVKMS